MSNYNDTNYIMGGGNSIMNYSCESFMDYAYEEDIVMEAFHPIRRIQNVLRNLCTAMYKKCDALYRKYKDTRPKLSIIFKKFAEFFYKHSNLVVRLTHKEECDILRNQIKKCDDYLKELQQEEFQQKESFNRCVEKSEQLLKELNYGFNNITSKSRVTKFRDNMATDEFKKFLDSDEPDVL